MHDYGDWRGGYDTWGWLLMLLMMALFFFGVVLVVRYLGRDWHRGSQSETALDVLKKRYAKGEIDKKDYDEKHKDLMP